MKAGLSFSRWLIAPGIAVAFAAGNFAASRHADRERADGFRRNPKAESDGVSNASGSSMIGAGGSLQEVKQRVIKRWETSPAVMVDFELREETRCLLERVPVADLEAWLREFRSEDPYVDYGRDTPLRLRDMVLKVLASRSGSPLIRSFAEHPPEDGDQYMADAMNTWIEHDPAAVLAWLGGGDVPEAIKEDVEDYQEDALVQLAGKDPIEFERRLAGVDQETRESILEQYAYRRGNAEDRAGLLERAARSPHGEAMALWEGLIRTEGSNDPERAYATLAELEISTSDRATLDQSLVAELLNGFYTGGEDRSGVMKGWVERNPGSSIPEGVLFSFERWSATDPERAVVWVADQPSGPRYDLPARSLILKHSGSQELDYPTAAKMASLIGDPVVREGAQNGLKKMWQSVDAAAADEWEKNLPSKNRER